MKKFFFALLGLLVIIFVGLVYLSVSETRDNFRTCEILGAGDIAEIDFKDFDSVRVAANSLYEASALKQLMQGEQYREAWMAPVTVPIAFLDTLKGGLQIIEAGGGKQTHSLELKDRNGIRYTLRSLSKDPEKLVPDFAKTLGLENIIVDGVSAQHPYSALVVARLSEFAEILHTEPELMFVPKQPLLKEFNDKYGNRLYFLEFESKGEVDWTGLEKATELVDTDNLLELKAKDDSNIEMDSAALVRARLFDILIGDWDRHAKQWGWVLRQSGSGLLATPVPTDRDNAFFKQGGILPALISNNITLPKIQPFDEEVDYLPGLVREFDEYFLRTYSSSLFEREAANLMNALNRDRIKRAFLDWPEAVDAIDGEEIRKRLLSRRDSLIPMAIRFHGILSERPIEAIELKGCEDIKLKDSMRFCFDCSISEENDGNIKLNG